MLRYYVILHKLFNIVPHISKRNISRYIKVFLRENDFLTSFFIQLSFNFRFIYDPGLSLSFSDLMPFSPQLSPVQVESMRVRPFSQMTDSRLFIYYKLVMLVVQ